MLIFHVHIFELYHNNLIFLDALPVKVAHFFLPENIPNTDFFRYMKKN